MMVPMSAIERHRPALEFTAYGGAHYGKSLFWYTTELLFGFYLAEIYEIPPATLGVLLFVFLLWDAITDPVVGLAIWRRRISTASLLCYQLLGAVLSSIAFLLIFLKPSIESAWLTVYAIIVGLIFRSAYTIFDVPQNAMFHRLANSNDQRLLLSSLRTALSALATLSVSIAAFLVLQNDDLQVRTTGFVILASVFVVVALCSAALLFAVVSGTVRNCHDEGETLPPTSVSVVFKTTLLQPELRHLFLGIFFLSFGWPLFGKLVPFFAVYVIGEAEFSGALIAAMGIAALISQPIWIAMGSRLDRSSALKLMAGIVCVSGLVFGVCAQMGSMAALAATSLFAASASAMGVLAWAILADKLSDNRLAQTNDVIAFGAFTFSSKVALGFGGLTLGGLLQAIGYETGEPLSDEGQLRLIWAMALIPIATTLIATGLTLKAVKGRKQSILHS